VVATHASRACSVVAPEVMLPGTSPAPRNAHVWFMGISNEMSGGATFALVASPGTPGTPLAPALDVRVWERSELLELVPRTALEAGTRYDLWAVPHKPFWAPKSQRTPPALLLGTFRTGDDVDTAAPSAPALKRAVRKPSFASCDAWLEVEVATPAADAGGGAVLYALWFAGAGPIAYDAPPELVVVYTAETQSLDVEDPARAKVGLRVGVRAVDLAGNLSAPVEATVEPGP
jgi:hypothetical protein